MPQRRPHRGPGWSFTSPPTGAEPADRLRGTAAILRHLTTVYPDRQVGPGVLLALLLDQHSVLLGHGRVRDLPPDLDLPTSMRPRFLTDLLTGLRDNDPAGAAGFAVLLVTIRTGAARLSDSDIAWWTAFDAACQVVGLHAADVLVSAPDGWLTVRAGTAGPGDWQDRSSGNGQPIRLSRRCLRIGAVSTMSVTSLLQ